MASIDHPPQPDASASGWLRRTAHSPNEYTLEVGARNTGDVALRQWQAIITIPTGARMTATDEAVLSNDNFPQIYLASPSRAATIAPGGELVLTLTVSGTDHAPIAAQITTRTEDGLGIFAPIEVVSVCRGDGSEAATDETWPGAPALVGITAA